MLARAASLSVVVALAFVAPAAAWTPPGDRPADSPLVAMAVGIAETFWQDRGVTVCEAPSLDVRIADDLSDGVPWQAAYGRGELNGCRVWFLAHLVAQAAAGHPGNESTIYLCRTAAIEIGHTGGLDDDYGSGGVMDPSADYADGTPWTCRMWGAAQKDHARELARRRRVVRRVLAQDLPHLPHKRSVRVRI